MYVCMLVNYSVVVFAATDRVPPSPTRCELLLYCIPANTKYFQNIFKRTENFLLETFTINMNKTLAKCSITIGKTLVK